MKRSKTILRICPFILISYAFGLIQENNIERNFDEKAALLHIEELEQSVKNIENQIQELNLLFDEKNEYFYTTRQEIQSLANNMIDTINGLKKDLKLLHTYKKEIQSTTEKLVQINKQQATTKEKIKSLTHMIYQLHNEIYENGEMNDLKLFLKSEQISSISSQELYIETLIQSLNNMLLELKEEKNNYSQMLELLYEKKRDMENKITRYQNQTEELEQKELYMIDFIKLYKSNKVELNNKIEELLQNRKEIEKQVLDIMLSIDQNRFNPQNRDRRSKKESLISMRTRGTQENFLLSRPVLPIKDINHYFKDKSYEETHSHEHNGIQIVTAQGTPIHAPLDGIVIKASDNYNIGINRIMLAHKDKITTTYLYLNKLIVDEGQVVRQGEVIGYSGGEPGTNGAGIISRSPNLTFLIGKGQRFLDPLKLLDLSAISDPDIIPNALSMKYHRDIQKMAIDITSTAFIEGDTLKERWNTFLKTYAQGVYRTTSLREQAGEEHAIDPIFVSCIVFAETTLGKNFASANNPGNVGNPDDPNIRTKFDSPIDGVRAIYDTLDNKALHNRFTIDELSGFGELNKGLPLYASSNFNRQNNIQRCLTSIYGFYVPKNFPFRTGPVTRITSSFEASKTTLNNK